ncbi:MAG: aconitate hydratase [Oscillospiraceae bacterium]|nr:aconitate hydratase [Oscillospiraceae bacterium]
MAFTLTEKIINAHIISGEAVKGGEISLKTDQTLTQDATGTMAYLQFEAMGVKRVKTERSVAYIDHNTLQTGYENADDHRYIGSVAKKHGIYFSRPGNGICHQVHLERFGKPGKTLIGSDSHTPTCGGIGMFAVGAGGLDVAVAMGGGGYHITYPEIVGIKLSGKLNKYVSAKDIILKVLKELSVKGGVGRVIEYFGEGVKSLSVPERATVTNMGAELGATTSLFPSDEATEQFLKAQGRGGDYVELSADEGAVYDKVLEINLSELVPLAACPHSPDNIKSISELEGKVVNQVCIGSCTNGSLQDLFKVAGILKGKTVHEGVDLSIAPGSKQVLNMLAESGALSDLIAAGARILECTCGPCIGMGQSPVSGGVSLRTFNRNFLGRSGTKDAEVYLVSPETAAASAVAGAFTDPRNSDGAEKTSAYVMPESFLINDNMITLPADEVDAANVEVLRGPNIKPFPSNSRLTESITAELVLKLGDNITTDHIMPAGAKILPLRSNIPAISEYCFAVVDEEFPARAKAAKEKGGGVIVGGANYGQGSSREHAALAPVFLGIKAVICKSFARIHKQNLINNGIIPLTFKSDDDYVKLEQGATIELPFIKREIENNEKNQKEVTLRCGFKGGEHNVEIKLNCEISKRDRDMLIAGGLLNMFKN